MGVQEKLDDLRRRSEKLEQEAGPRAQAIREKLAASIRRDSLKSHWEGLQALFAELKSPEELQLMKRCFYAGAAAALAVVKEKALQIPDDMTDEQGVAVYEETAAEAITGLIEAVLEKRD